VFLRGRRRILLLSLIGLALALAAAAAGAWFFRDLPRRRVEAILAGRLGAEVRLGRLSVEGTKRFVLYDLVVRRMAGQPFLDALRVARLTAEGSLTGIAAGRFDALRIEGLEARLAPPAPGAAAPAAGAPAELHAGVVSVSAGRVILAAGGGETSLVVDVDASRVGEPDLAATVRFHSDRLELAPLVAMFSASTVGQRSESVPAVKISAADPVSASAENLRGVVEVTRDGRVASVTVEADRFVGSVTGQRVEFSPASLRGSVRQDTPDSPLKLEMAASLPFADTLQLTGELDPARRQPLRSRLTARAVRLGPLFLLTGALPAGWRIEGTADCDWSQEEESDPHWSLSVRAAEAAVEIPGVSARPHGLALTMEGTSAIRLSKLGGPVSARVAIAGGEAHATDGTGWSVPADLFPVEVQSDGTLSLAPARLSGALRILTAAFGDLRATGPVDLLIGNGADPTAGPRARLDWNWTGSDLGRLAYAARSFGFDLRALALVSGTVSAFGTVDGPLASPTVAATVSVASLTAGPPVSRPSKPAWSLTGASAKAGVRFEPGSGMLRVENLKLDGTVATGPLAPMACSLTARGRVPLRGGTAVLDLARIEVPGAIALSASGQGDAARLLKAFSPSVAAGAPQDASAQPGASARPVSVAQPDAAPQPEASAEPDAAPQPATAAQPAAAAHPDTSAEPDAAALKIAFDEVSLPRWRELLRPLTGDLLPGYALQGTATGEASVRLDEAGAWSADGRAAVRGSGFTSVDGARALQGLDTAWRWQARGDVALSSLGFDAEADVGGFEVLWDSLFADGKDLPSKLAVSGTLAHPESETRDGQGRARWDLSQGPTVAVSARFTGSQPLSFELSARADDLSTTVRRYLKELLGESIPLFSRIEAGGVAELDATGRLAGPTSGSAAPTDSASRENHVEGRLRLEGVQLAGTEGFVEVRGLDLDLPLDLTWVPPVGSGGSAATGSPFHGEPRTGRLQFDRLSVGGLDVPPTQTALKIRGDSFEFEEIVTVPVLGGRVALERVRFADLLSARRRMDGGVQLVGLRLEKAAAAFGLPPLTGEMNGVFPQFLLTPDSFHVEGGGEMSLFGGTLKVGDISGVDILSRYPQMTFSAEFRDIDLGQVTRTFNFGEMTGILQGWVRDCELFRGVPVGFEGQVETVKRDGVGRTVNVKAVNNLAILGTGGGVGALGRGLTRFIRKFTYDAFGIHMTLADDAFLLRGLQQSRGREMFLTRRLPFPIEIVNGEPGTPISFSEMLERLRSLDVNAASTQPPGDAPPTDAPPAAGGG